MKLKIIAIVLLFCPVLIFGQKWNYPVKPGTQTWATLKSGEDKLKACQIPDDVLRNITSPDLAILCMEYPLFFEYTAFNNEQQAILIMIENFNGLRELSKRKDGTLSLMKIYSQMKIQENEGYIEKGENSSVLHYQYIELLLFSDVFLNKLNVQEQKKLKKTVVDKYDQKLRHINIYGIHGIKKSLLLGAKIIGNIETAGKNKSVIQNYLKYHNSATPAQLKNISKIITENEN